MEKKITVSRKKAKKLTVSRKKAKILTVNRKSPYPIETLLEVACFKANSTWINDIGSKDLSNRPIYAVKHT